MEWQQMTDDVEDGVYVCRNKKQYEYGVYYMTRGKWCTYKNYIPLPTLKGREDIEIARIDI